MAARAEADAAARPSSRRLAAILHADLVGFSRLMSDDEAEAHRTLRVELDVMTASVGAHQGRVVNYAGDALLAEFATASGALACALELQAEIDRLCAELREDRGLPVRIGLSVGEVIVDGEEIYGHGVNVAVRLQALAAPGETLASESFRVATGATPGVSFKDRGAHELKNIAEPMRVYRVVAGRAPAATRFARPATPRRSWRGPTLAAGIALVLAVAAGWLYRDQLLGPAAPSAPAAQGEPAIAVLPFVNLSDDAKQDYFVDGMTEDLITDLSKLSGLLVISRNTALSLKERSVPTPELARELGVRYVLEGSVRRAGDRIRVNAQLIDARSDRHIWAERYDRELTDVFTVQDEVKREIVEALALQLTSGEQVALAERPTASLEAYEYYLRARAAMYDGEPRSLRLARYAFEKAAQLDPAFAEAYAGLAMVNALDFAGPAYWSDWTRSPATAQANVEPLARKALGLKPALALAELAMARLRLAELRFEEAVTHAERAVAMQAGSAEALVTLARTLTAVGRHDEAFVAIEEASRRNPVPDADQLAVQGIVQFGRRDYTAAASSLGRATKLMKAGADWLTETFLEASRGYEPSRPPYQAGWLSITVARLFPPYLLATDMEHLVEGLRRAGVPEYPDGFEPAEHAAKRVPGAELQSLLYGRALTGPCPVSRQQTTFRFAPDGTTTWQLRHDVSDTAPADIRDDQICFSYPVLTRHRAACFLVFRDQDVTVAGAKYDYMFVGPNLCYLSFVG